MKKLLLATALSLSAVSVSVSEPVSAVGIVCNTFIGTDTENNTWVQWKKCGGLEQNNYMARVRGKFCTWFDNDCFTFSGQFVHENWEWSKLTVSAAKFERKGVWVQLCPETGCV
jgi:hypothetical protein